MIKIPTEAILSAINTIHEFTAKNKFMPQSIIFDETDPKWNISKVVAETPCPPEEDWIFNIKPDIPKKKAKKPQSKDVWDDAFKVFEDPRKNINVFEYITSKLISEKYSVDKSRILHTANMRMIGLDELDTIELIMDLEDALEIEIEDKALGISESMIGIDEIVTVGNLVRLIETLLKGSGV